MTGAELVPSLAETFGAGVVGGLAVLVAGGLWAFGRWLIGQVVEGVDERTNGRIERALTDRLDEFRRDLEQHRTSVLDEVRRTIADHLGERA
jgi:hypothetical protein